MQDKVMFSKEDIGGDILPILTTGLYRNKLDALREYIQNAIDAKCKKIELVIDPDTIMVEDDGFGMNFSQAKNAMKLGISEKNPTENIGFRGIGIYSAYNLCDRLDIYTRSESDTNCNLIHIDFKSARLSLLKDQQRKKQNLPTTIYLEKLLENIVSVQVDQENTITNAGTRAIMSELRDEVFDELNDWGKVESYLQNVVPLPFREDFKFSSIITNIFKEEDYKVVPVTLQIKDRREEIRRPYYNEMFAHGGKHKPEIFNITDGKQHFGFAWVCVNDARRVLKDTALRGLLIKKFDFSISDRNYLEHFFSRPVFNRRITGEVIIQNKELIPNAARGDFEHNSTRQSFIQTLPKFTKAVSDWANKIQQEEKAREILALVKTELREISIMLPSIRRDREIILQLNVQLHYIESELKTHAKTLKKLENEDYEEAHSLLKECQVFVSSSLVKGREEQIKIEQQVLKSIQREADKPTEIEERIEDIPRDVIDLVNSYGMQIPEEIIGILHLLDDNYLRPYLSEEEYSEMIDSLREHLEQ